MQSYPHIVESHACILKIFVVTFLFAMNVLTYFGIYLTSKLSKYGAS